MKTGNLFVGQALFLSYSTHFKESKTNYIEVGMINHNGFFAIAKN